MPARAQTCGPQSALPFANIWIRVERYAIAYHVVFATNRYTNRSKLGTCLSGDHTRGMGSSRATRACPGKAPGKHCWAPGARIRVKTVPNRAGPAGSDGRLLRVRAQDVCAHSAGAAACLPGLSGGLRLGRRNQRKRESPLARAGSKVGLALMPGCLLTVCAARRPHSRSLRACAAAEQYNLESYFPVGKRGSTTMDPNEKNYIDATLGNFPNKW
jgi:hypothetical protein